MLNKKNDNFKSGIKACYYDNPFIKGDKILLNPETVLYLRAGKTHKFYVVDDNNILGEKTEKRSETITEAKWAFLLAYYWKEAKKMDSKATFPLWADLKGSEPIDHFGIANQYKKGDSIIISPKSDDVWIGYFYRMEVFNYTPGIGLNFDFMVLDKPKIRMAYFDKQILKENNNKFSINDGHYSYGQVVTLYLNTHLLPMKIDEFYHKKYGRIFSEESFKNLVLIVHLTDEKGNIVLENPIISDKLQKFLTTDYATTSNQINVTAANINFEIPILLETDWKDKIHLKSEKIKYYSVLILIQNSVTKAKYNYTPNMKSLTTITKSNFDFEDREVNSKFSVKYESMDTILENMSTEKNNMIQYIGDVKYTKKENNTCAYSIITVNNGVKDFEVFNEYKLGPEITDDTENFTEIVAGDGEKQKKEVKISVKFLEKIGGKIESVRTAKNGNKCEQILNDGEDHFGIYDVFKMNWIVGQWIPSKDPRLFPEHYEKMLKMGGMPNFVHYKNAKSAPKLKWGKSDQEAKGIESPDKELYEAVSVAGIQGFTNDDYSIDEPNDSITLKLQYHYNKTVAEDIHKYTTSAINKLWIFNYFRLHEKHAQIYFVPVTTCRYPNQIVKFRVFPDIQWGITFSIGAVDPKYKEDWRQDLTEKRIKVLEEYKGSVNYSLPDKAKQAEIDKKKATLQKLDLKLGFSASAGSEEYNLTPDFGNKVTDVIYAFGRVKELLGYVVGTSEDSPSTEKKKKKYLESAKKSSLLNGLTKLPIEIVIDNPALSCGFSWGFRHVAAKNKVTRSYDIFIKASPIISASGTLDLIALAGYIPVFGQAINVVDIVLEASGIDASFFITASGKIDFGLTLKIGEEDSLSEGDLGFDGEFKIRVEASLTIGGGIIGFLFAAGDWKGNKVTEYKAYGETGLTGTLKAGADAEGPYIDANISFAGLIFVAEKTEKDDELGASKTKKIGPYIVIEESLLIGNKYYLNNNTNEKIN